MSIIYGGIDHGASGGAAYVDESGILMSYIRFSNTTWADVSIFLNPVKIFPAKAECKFLIERVAARPAYRDDGQGGFKVMQGISSTFKFGYNAGLVEGLLIGHGHPYEFVAPAVWQRALGCLSGGDKNVTKAKAQQLWPEHHRWTKEEPDACLIAEYCRRHALGLLKKS